MRRILSTFIALGPLTSAIATPQIEWTRYGTVPDGHYGIALTAREFADFGGTPSRDFVAGGSAPCAGGTAQQVWEVLAAESGAVLLTQGGAGHAVGVELAFGTPGILAGNSCSKLAQLGGLPVAFSDTGFGHAVTGVDFDGDGSDEIVVSAPTAGGAATGGRLYVFRGASFGYALMSVFPNPHPSPSTFSMLGWSLDRIADQNGDGSDDLLVGAPTLTPIGTNARVYVLSWNGSSLQITAEYGGASRFGTRVLGLSDLDGDLVADFAVGEASIPGGCAPYSSPVSFPLTGLTQPGLVHVVRSSLGVETLHPPLDLLEPTFGFALASGADLDQDGLDDLLVGEPCLSVTGSGLDRSGAVFVYSGSDLKLVGGYAPVGGGERFGYSIATSIRTVAHCFPVPDSRLDPGDRVESDGEFDGEFDGESDGELDLESDNAELDACEKKGGTPVVDLLPIVAIGAPRAIGSGSVEVGAVYAFEGMQQIPLHSCCPSPPCPVTAIDCYSDSQSGLPCRRPRLFLRNAANGEPLHSWPVASDVDVSIDISALSQQGTPTCFPIGSAPNEIFFLLASTEIAAPGQTACFGAVGCAGSLQLHNPSFLFQLGFGNLDIATGEGCFFGFPPLPCVSVPIAGGTLTSLAGTKLQLGAMIFDSYLGKPIVGSTPHTVRFLP